jgi:rhamnose transport system ATP-binding protein
MSLIDAGNVPVVLQATGLVKSFAGVRALRDGSLTLNGGEIHALIGENGAGKSTLIRLLAGALAPEGGELSIGGQLVTEFSPLRARELGVSVIYQQPALFPELSVAENLALGLEPPRLWRRVDHRARLRRAAALLERVGAAIDPQAPVRQLSMPQQQLLEIARALGRESKILILDEPTASLSEREVANLFRILQELRRQGLAIVYISHRMEEIFSLADRVTVLRDGQTIATHAIDQIDRPTLIRLMVGRELAADFSAQVPGPVTGEAVLRIESLSSRTVGLADITLELHAGEILGLAGLVGAGRSELARTIFGLHPLDAGRILIRSRDQAWQTFQPTAPAEAIEAGIAYVPEDRRRHGVIAELSIIQNDSLAVLSRISTAGFIDRRAERQLALDYADRLRLKAATLYDPVSTLSGGNQQKVALTRWLATNPRILILDEPTQGIDVGAKAEIHRLMRELAATGLAILMISSELPEIIGLSDRIAVMRAGRIAATLDRQEVTPESIISIALGHADEDRPQPD